MSNYLIISSSTIGQAIAQQLVREGQQVFIAARNQPCIPGAIGLELDIDSPACYTALAEHVIKHDIQVIISCIGLLHKTHHKPEKTITAFDADWFIESMRVNCLTNIELLTALSKHLPRATTLKFIAFSARVGSISDNALGGWISYRTAKAALNMAIKTIALEWKRCFPHATLITYHPGSVTTPLSAPFTTPHPFSPEKAAEDLLTFIPQLEPSMSGNLYDWKHTLISF